MRGTRASSRPRFDRACALDGELLKLEVRVDTDGAWHASPRPVIPELPRQRVVGQVDGEDLVEPVAHRRRGHRYERFDPPVEVTRHEVGRPDDVLSSVRIGTEPVDA